MTKPKEELPIEGKYKGENNESSSKCQTKMRKMQIN